MCLSLLLGDMKAGSAAAPAPCPSWFESVSCCWELTEMGRVGFAVSEYLRACERSEHGGKLVRGAREQPSATAPSTH
jgi:hypothetical protein